MHGPNRPFPAPAPAGAVSSGAAPTLSEMPLTATGLVGRDAELTVVAAAFDTAAAGRPTVVLLTGEAGIGKTRLADLAATRARTVGMQVLRGEADAAIRQPMELWRGVYRALGTVPASDPALPAEERRWEYLESLADALTAAAPAVVVLEDLHWADPTAIWVLEHLPRALGDAPVALLATSRDHEPDMPALESLRRVSRLVQLGGLDVDAVRLLAAAEAPSREGIDPVELHARTGGNPLFVQELLRAPGGTIGSDVIGQVLQRSLDRFDPRTRELLATAAVAGAGTPLQVLATADGLTTGALTAALEPALRAGVLDDVSATGVRFHHALLAETAERLSDATVVHARLASAWQTVGGLDGQAAAVSHLLRALTDEPAVTEAVEQSREVAVDLIAAGRPARAAGLLTQARDAAARWPGRVELRATLALDLAEILGWLGDREPSMAVYQEAAELARGCQDPVVRARAEIGVNLWATAFVPDLPRMRRLEDALEALPADELRLRASLLGRLTIIGGADVDATERVRAWADEGVAAARATGDPVLLAQAILDQTQSVTSPSALDAAIIATEEVIRLAERAGRSDLALSGHQRRAGHHLNHGELGAASQRLGRAEVLAALQPNPWWRYSTLLQRTTVLALSGSRAAATTSMQEAVRVGTGHVEPVVVLGCEALHQLMLFDLYGYADDRTQEIHRITMAMLDQVPSPVFQVQKGFGAQLFGDQATVQEVLHRFGSRPEQLLRSMTGDHLLRDFGDMVARAGAEAYAGPAYRALLPYAGLLNVAGGHSAGLPVDDVLGRLALLDGDIRSALRHCRDAVALARSMPSPPLLVHCLDHLADAVERGGDGGDLDADALRAEAVTLAAASGVVRGGRLSAAPGAHPRGSASIRRDGTSWILHSPIGDARLPDSNGPRQLARLLAAPFVEVAAVELAGSPPIAADLGPGLDARAKREYRHRLHVLQAEMEDAETARDHIRAERAQVEMEALLRELKRAVGLGGRDRPTGSDAERARVNVVRSLRRTITAIGQQAPLLGGHLDESVRTGRHCIYLPEPGTALQWAVSPG